jgi:glycosyltransferase involved in cell wall biosynthesis
VNAMLPIDRLPSETPVVLDARVVTGTGGGPDKTILNSPRFLEPMGYRNLCAYMHPPGDSGFEVLRRRAEDWGAPLISIPDRGPWDWRVVTQLLAVCRREKVAIWHGHDYKSNALGLLLRRFWPMRLVTTVHGWVKHTRRTPLYYGIDRFCLRQYEAVISVSDDLHQRCLECGVPPQRCLLVENGIDIRQFARTRSHEEAKHLLGIPCARLLIGAIGRLSEEKGFDLLIQAVDRLLAGGLDVELRIAGEGDQHGRLDDLIRTLHREDRIRLVGFQPETIPLFEAMDVFALSSLREGLPNVVLEAMAMGVPVVATRVAGVPRLIEQEKDGLLVNIGDGQELGSALARLLDDTDWRNRLGDAGRWTVGARYSLEGRMQRIREIYDELLSVRCDRATVVLEDETRSRGSPIDPEPTRAGKTN